MIYRVIKDKDNPYVMMNRAFLKDDCLSWRAKGILSYLLSLPDDWQVYEQELAKHSANGLKDLKSGIRELMALGYVQRSKIRGDKGRYNGWEYHIYEVPTMRFADVGETDVRETHPTDTNSTDTNRTDYNKHKGFLPDGGKTPVPCELKDEDVVRAIRLFMHVLYPRYTRRKHPYLKPDQYRDVYISMAGFTGEHTVTLEGWKDMMEGYFRTHFNGCDYHINHFATEGVMMNRYYEAGQN